MAESRGRKKSPEERREQILQAALTLFAKHGYQRTTTKEIARAAGVSEGTIYIYFAGKQELLAAFLESEVFKPLTMLFASLDTDDDTRIISAFLADRFSVWDKYGDFFKVYFSEALFNSEIAQLMTQQVLNPARKVIGHYFQRRVSEGVFRKVDPIVATHVLMGSIFFHFLMWKMLATEEELATPREALINGLTSLFLDGIRIAPTGRLDG